MRLDRPIGIWLLLWPALWALWISADGPARSRTCSSIFVLGTFVTRSAGCVDQRFRGSQLRSARRAHARSPAGDRRRSSPVEALALFAALGLIALGLVMTLNRLTQLLALVGARARRHLSVHEALLPDAAVLSRRRVLLVACRWRSRRRPASAARSRGCCSSRACSGPMAYDTMYAMVDREDDLQARRALDARSCSATPIASSSASCSSMSAARAVARRAASWSSGCGIGSGSRPRRSSRCTSSC